MYLSDEEGVLSACASQALAPITLGQQRPQACRIGLEPAGSRTLSQPLLVQLELQLELRQVEPPLGILCLPRGQQLGLVGLVGFCD